jgi:hypothetical protein
MQTSPYISFILGEIVELGYISLRNGRVIEAVEPLVNVYTDKNYPFFYNMNRWNLTVQYLSDYAKYHLDFQGEYFLCIYDGWREYSEPVDEDRRQYTQWLSLEPKTKANFLNRGGIDEPRFYNSNKSFPELYPELPLPILTYNRHKNDKNVFLIPDTEFLEGSFQKFTKKVISYDIPFEEKLEQLFWRGSAHVNEGYKYTIQNIESILKEYNVDRLHPRILANFMSRTIGWEPDISQYLNASFEKTDMSEMLRYKFQLGKLIESIRCELLTSITTSDLDGMVSAWSALYWKLYSNSVVVKGPSHWEQWYYEDLKPFKHFIPLESFHPSDLLRVKSWCDKYFSSCKKISEMSSSFVKQLTYEYAVKDYIIH